MNSQQHSHWPATIDALGAMVKGLYRIAVFVALVLAVCFFWSRMSRATPDLESASGSWLQHPVELKDSIENLPASSSDRYGLTLPYTGILTIDITVLRGNSVDVYLVKPDQVGEYEHNLPFAYLAGFDAARSRSYLRSEREMAGDYYLVLRDEKTGEAAVAPSSDIRVHVRLEP